MSRIPLIKIEGIYPKDREFPYSLARTIDKEIKVVLTTAVKTRLKNGLSKRVANWRKRPRFSWKYTRTGFGHELFVFPSGGDGIVSIYKWVSGGTNRSGFVSAKNAPNLVFRTKYKARTAPGNVYGRRRQKYGPLFVGKKVKKSSIPAREFEKHVVREERRQIEEQIKRVIYKSIGG